MATAFKGQLPVFRPSQNEDKRESFRAVPASDRGDERYGDRGMLGSYPTNDGKQWKDPEGVKHFSGYGCSEADYELGYQDAGIREDPAYDKANYHERFSEPKVADEDQLETNVMEDDWAFRNRERRSRGFLTRPRIPTERN